MGDSRDKIGAEKEKVNPFFRRFLPSPPLTEKPIRKQL